jgi:phospholipid/cholesterol/gamma-HCH transport system substrate-binding protein
MSYSRTEIIAGLFVLAGLAAVAYLSLSVGGFELLPQKRYPVIARFASVGDLRGGAAVRIAGVDVGRVTSIELDDHVARVELAIDRAVPLSADTIASIRTEGLLGQAYVSLSPGAAEEMIQPGGRIAQTEPAIDLLDLIGKYAFGGSREGEGSANGEDVFGDPLEEP